MDIIPLITVFHYNFVRIHPFQDTNGRTVRLVTALYLLRRSFPSMIIEPSDRQQYMNALAWADFNRDLKPLALFFCECMKKTYKDMVTSFA
jgi:Fic family protein